MKRIMIVAAHPDDEVLGCGATISKYRASGVVFRVVFLERGPVADLTIRLICWQARR